MTSFPVEGATIEGIHSAMLTVSSDAVDGQPVGDLTRDEILDNITLYWLTNTGVSASRSYRENKVGFFDFKGVTVPAAVTVFPNELYQAREAGPSRPTPTSSTSTRSERATSSPPGRSWTSSRPRYAPHSGHYADRHPHQQRRSS